MGNGSIFEANPRMNLKDYIGKRGENLFRVIITSFCEGRPWFDEVFLGEKHPTTDFMVELIEPTSGGAFFFVQVKATTSGYTGQGANRRLKVRVSRGDLEKLLEKSYPAYVVGIDIESGLGYLLDPRKAKPGGITGISTANLLDCSSLRALWNEVDDFWNHRRRTSESS
jgi:hypothetical protein